MKEKEEEANLLLLFFVKEVGGWWHTKAKKWANGLAMWKGGRQARPRPLGRRAEQACEPCNVAPQGEAAAEAPKKKKDSSRKRINICGLAR